MHVMRLAILLSVFVTGISMNGAGAQATPQPSTGGIGTAACDFNAIKNSLYSTESSSAGSYTALNRRTGAAGKYQFMPATRDSYIRRHPECNAQNCQTTAQWTSGSAECNAAQECIMDAFTNDNLSQIRRDPACQQLLANGGQVVTGSGQGNTLTCRVTESGLLAAFHLGGWDECRKMLANGRGDNDGPGGRGGTDVSYYTCRHGGLAVPGNCTPSPANTSGTTAGPTGTQAQADFSGIDLSGPLDPLREWWDAALMLMAEQFTANMAAQVEAIGMMFDAKHQLETQRLFQEKTAEAHRDYQPSEQMCTFGTFARDLVATERVSNASKAMVAEHILEREIGQGDGMALSRSSNRLSRIAQFRRRFCDRLDNAIGLDQLCPNQPPENMRNRDINFTQTIDQPLSLDIDLNDPAVSEDEETVFALVDNLFATQTLPRPPEDALELRKYNYNYLNLRSVVAMRGIARNSIANIIALKTATPNRDDRTNAPYLRALLREFGLNDAEIEQQLGPNPSYYAQMEFLTRKMYQNPIFYTNLYDKPTNVKRIGAAMKAIKLMQDRDIQAALQRREMLMSMMLELKLRDESNEVYDTLEKGLFAGSMGSGGTRQGQQAPTPTAPVAQPTPTQPANPTNPFFGGIFPWLGFGNP